MLCDNFRSFNTDFNVLASTVFGPRSANKIHHDKLRQFFPHCLTTENLQIAKTFKTESIVVDAKKQNCA